MGGRMRHKLTALEIKNAGNGKLQDGGGLFLIKAGETGRWMYRFQLNKRRREMGLGSLSDVSLAAARKRRDHWAAVLATGKDPIDEKRRIEADEDAQRNRLDPTFKELAKIVFDAKKAGLRDEGKAGRWMSPIERHVFPMIGQKPVSQITASHIKDALAPIWKTKHDTAQKAMQRTRIILRGGKRMGMPCDHDISDTAEYMLGEVVHVSVPIPATPWQDIPALYQRLEGRGTAAACLQFMILTVVRSAGCRGARFSEIDGDVWVVPADRMKGRIGKVQDFNVPLSEAAIELVARLAEMSDDLLFPGLKTGKGISDTSLAKILNTLEEPGRPHGFRSSFRTWVQDNDVATFDVAETALAHRIGNVVERSYARSDLLYQRRILAEKWAQYVTGATAANVVDLKGRSIK